MKQRLRTKRRKSNVIYIKTRIAKTWTLNITSLSILIRQLTEKVPLTSTTNPTFRQINIALSLSELISPVVSYRHRERRRLARPGVRLSKSKTTIITWRLFPHSCFTDYLLLLEYTVTKYSIKVIEKTRSRSELIVTWLATTS